MAEAASAEFRVLEAKNDGGDLVLSVEVGKDVVSQAFRKVHKELLRHVRVPGFRPGKVPLPVLSNAVGRENFAREVRKELLPRYYYDALKTTEYQPVDRVQYEAESLEHGEPFTFKARVSVAPQVKLGEYRKLSLEFQEPEAVDDKAVEKALLRLQQDHAQSKKAEDEVVQEGDYVLVGFTGQVNGKDFKTLTKDNQGLLVGNDDFLPGFDKNLIGKKKGEEFTFALTLPKKGTDNEFLVGKKVMFKGKVKSVFRQELPEVNDEFAKTLGRFDGLEQLKTRLREDLDKRRERSLEKVRDEGIRKALAGTVSVELPAALVTRRVEERLEEFKSEIKSQELSFEEYLEEYGKTAEDLKKELEEKVIERLKSDFALDEIARQESLVVSDEEFDQRIRTIARVLDKDPDEIFENMDESGQRTVQRQEMLREKAFDSIRQHYK